MNQLYYLLWQRSAREIVHELHRAQPFDLFHHVTFAGFRYPTAVWGHGAPCIWGPIGGIESIPVRLLPWFHFKSLLREFTRDTHNLIQSSPFHILPRHTLRRIVPLTRSKLIGKIVHRLLRQVRRAAGRKPSVRV